MSKEAIERAILEQLNAKRKSVLNHNAINALFGAFTDPVGSLGKIFIGRGDVVEAEKQKITQEMILDLLCKIDEVITQTAKASEAKGITLSGLIETSANGADKVVGVQIDNNSGPVTLRPGTHIRTTANGSRSVTGLRIGGETEKK